MTDDQRQAAVGALIAEYAALRAESVARVKTQSHGVPWMLLLTGGAIGLLLTKNLWLGSPKKCVEKDNKEILGKNADSGLRLRVFDKAYFEVEWNNIPRSAN